MVSPWIGQDEKTRLAERCLKLIGEGTRSVTASNGMTTCVLSKLQHSPLSIWTCRLDNNVLRVFDGNNHPGSHLKLLPCLPEVNYVNSCTEKENDNKNVKYKMNLQNVCLVGWKQKMAYFNIASSKSRFEIVNKNSIFFQ